MRTSFSFGVPGALRAALLLLAAAPACGKPSDVKPARASGETVAAQAGSMPPDSAAQRAAADSGRILGAPTAKVWMIIASDFQCPYCKMWHDQSFDALRKEYVDAGRVRMAYVNYPLSIHEQAKPSAEAAMCASAQHKFWEYHTALFQSQDSWIKPGDQSAKFDSLATALGLDGGRFRGCMQSHVMRALIEADQDRMQRSGVGSTPTFFIGNYKVEGAQPLADFRRAVDQALSTSAP